MGANRRYADGLQRKRFNRDAESHALVPRTLSEIERGPDPVVRGEPVPVKAWIDYGNASAQVLGSAIAWTRRAVCVLWTDSYDRQQEAWVWAGAVERIDPR